MSTTVARVRDWDIRLATPADHPRMNVLFDTVFHSKRPPEHDRWRFSDDPFGPPLMLLAESDKGLVGQYGLWPTPMRLGTEVYMGAQCIDAVILPEYQGQGVFTTLAARIHEIAAEAGVVAIYAVPNANSYHAFRHRLNMGHVFDFPRWTRIINPGGHPSVPRAAGPVLSLIARALPNPHDRSFEVNSGWPSAEAVEPLLEKWRAERGLCRIERSMEWWRYRFAEDSGRNYRCITAWRHGRLAALAVWGVDPFSNYQRATVAELLFEDARAGTAVLSATVDAARTHGQAVLNTVTVAKDTEVIAVLRSCGFLKLKATPFIARQLSARTLRANVIDPDAWRIFGADLDTL